jgi:large subunit ribosomal protein L13
MKTIFPKKESHIPKWFVVDATDKKVGRLATEVSKLLRGKENSFFTPGVDQGNYVVILNAEKIKISGNKAEEKLYYRTSGRPGGLKVETFKDLKNRLPSRILEKAIWGMLPKGALGRDYYRRLFIYSGNEIKYKKDKNGETKIIPLDQANSNNWIKVEI